LLKTSDFLAFALIISNDKSQSKAQFNMQSLGGNKTGYLAEMKDFFSQTKTSRKVHIYLH